MHTDSLIYLSRALDAAVEAVAALFLLLLVAALVIVTCWRSATMAADVGGGPAER